MRHSAVTAALCSVIALAFAAAPLAAQAGGPYGPSILLLPSSPRTLGMGNVGVAGRDDDVLFWNPAQLAVARGTSASGERYSASAGGGSVASVTRFGDGGIAIGARMAEYDAPDNYFPVDRGVMLDAGPIPGSTVELDAGIGQTFKGFRVGATGKYAEDHAGTLRTGRAALDLGVAKDVMRYFTAALSVQNIGRAMALPCGVQHTGAQCDVVVYNPPAVGGGAVTASTIPLELPLRTTLGLSGAGPVGPLDLTATAAVSMLRSNWVSPAAGVEISYSWLQGYDVAFRAGARRPLPGEGTVTLGAGFTRDRVSIDYALETLSGSRLGHQIGIRIR